MGVGLEERGIVAILRVQPTAGSAFVDGRPIRARSKRSQEEKDFTLLSNNVYTCIYIFFSFFSSCGKYLNAPKSAANDGKRAKEEAADATD
jgi:hypothetical protein